MLPAMLILVLIYRIALRTTTTWRFIFPGAAATTILWWAVDLLFGPYVRKWVMARSTEVWPRGIRPHDLDGVFGHYRLSRSRLECRKLGETVSNCEQT